MWKLYAVLAAVFAAATAIMAKLGVKGINSTLATAVRTVVVVVMAWSLVAAQGNLSQVKNLSKNNILFLVLSGIATGLSWIFYFKALQEGEVSKVAVIDKLSVVITVVFAMLFLGEGTDTKTLIGVGLIICGTLVLLF